MDLQDYVERSLRNAQYPNCGGNLLYPTLGLCGEAGELAEKVKKLYRNHLITSQKGIDEAGQDENISKEKKNEIIKLRGGIISELGDVLWYFAAICSELDVDANSVALLNLEKLEDRVKRGVINSEGDNR